jgi:aminotransferase
MQEWQGIEVDPEKEIAVCCGSTEAMIATLLAVCNKGDEVVVFEPFYENYGPDAILSGAKPRFVSLRPPQVSPGEWTFDEQELREAFQPKSGQHKTGEHHTKAIIVNTPNNPTGKVFSRKELELIRDLCVEYNVLCITDEIYEHILYDGSEHISIARHDQRALQELQRDGMACRLGGCACADHQCDPQSA